MIFLETWMMSRQNNKYTIQHPTRGYKYLGNKSNHIILNYFPQFLVFYTPQGGTVKSDKVSGVRY